MCLRRMCVCVYIFMCVTITFIILVIVAVVVIINVVTIIKNIITFVVEIQSLLSILCAKTVVPPKLFLALHDQQKVDINHVNNCN